MPPIFKSILFGLGVFSLFILLALILKLSTGQMPVEADYFGLFTNNDLMLGLVVALVVTINHERKMRKK
jgi:hypothetical protein